MIRNSEVLTREGNRISLVSARRPATQGDYLAIAEMEIPASMTEQTWIFEIGQEARASRTTPKFAAALAKVVTWLNHLGSGEIDDSHLEARHNIHHSFRINGIGR
jgi:hypothetical protein